MDRRPTICNIRCCPLPTQKYHIAISRACGGHNHQFHLPPPMWISREAAANRVRQITKTTMERQSLISYQFPSTARGHGPSPDLSRPRTTNSGAAQELVSLVHFHCLAMSLAMGAMEWVLIPMSVSASLLALVLHLSLVPT